MKYRPFDSLVVDVEMGDVLSFNRCEVSDFAEKLNLPLDTSVNCSAPVELGYKEITQLRGDYAALYRDVRTFAFEPVLTNEQTAQLKRLLKMQDDLFRPALKNFYRCLSPEFYAWAEALPGNQA